VVRQEADVGGGGGARVESHPSRPGAGDVGAIRFSSELEVG
jgi:hypothetical protein